ncbi:hypothetical protein ABW20_dc0103330 [Dactylellina cionopaga]|nr:hypothetical protein ABW20_dc0103330 [Dactylellina cionopaga]
MADHQAIDYLRVLHDFDARSPDELTLKKNSKIELLERDEEYNDGWYLMSHEIRRMGVSKEAMAIYGSAINFEALRVKIRQKILFGANGKRSSAVYTTQWPVEANFPQTATNVIDKQAAPDSDIAPPPAYTSTEPKQEIPKRLSITPTELTVEDGRLSGSAKETVSAETPPLVLENNMDKRRISDDFKKEHPQIQKLSRSPVVEDTLSDIEEALSEIRTAPRSVGSHAQKSKQPPPIMETPEAHHHHHAGEHEFDDSASDYSRSAFDNESSLSLAIANQPTVSGYLEPRTSYAGRSRESIQQKPSDHPLQYSQQFSAEPSSDEEDEDAVETVYSPEEIMMWTPAQVSAYFQEQHLPLNICDKFEEQEISGSILLQLEMSHLKELEIGSFGKRFEVWKEIEKLQGMVKNANAAGSMASEAKDKKARHRSSSTPAGVLPRLPSLHNRPPARGGSQTHQEDGMFDHMNIIRESPTMMSPGSPPVPPPKSDHGSVIHSDGRSVSTASIERASSSGGQVPQRVPGAHGRDPSFDRSWTLKGHKANESSVSGRSRFTGDSGFASQSSWSIYANDRNTHMSGEDGGKRDRNVLHKKSGSSGSHGHHHVHGKKSSYTEEQRSRSGNNTPTPTSTPSSPQPYPYPSPHPHPPSPPHGVVSKQTFAVSERSYETAQLTNAYPYVRAHSPLGRDHIAHASLPSGYSSPSPASIVYHNTVKGRKRSTSEAHIMSLDSRARDSLAASVMPGGKPLSVERPPPVSDERHLPPSIQTRANYPQRSISDGADKAMAMSPMSQDTSSTLLSPNGSEHSTSIKITIDTPERKSDESKQRNGNSKEKDKKLRSVASASGIRQKSKKQLTSAYLEGLKEVTPSQAAGEADFSGWMKKRGSSAVVATWKSRFFVLKGRRLSYFYSMDDSKERGLIDITSHRVLPAADDRLVSLHASVASLTSSTPLSQASSANPGNGASPNPPSTPSKGGGWFTFKDESAPVISTFSANTMSLTKARAMRARPPGFGDSSTDLKPSPIIGLPIMNSQGSFNDSIESALAERHLIDDDAANAADDER